MHELAETETADALAASDAGSRKRPWPMWIAAGLAAVCAVAAVVSVVAWQSAERSADDAEADATEQAAQVDDLTGDLRAGEDLIAESQTQLEAMRAILQPGTAEALQGVYLRLIQAGCADSTADVESLITDVAAEVSSGSSLLAGRAGWEAAIDRDAVADAISECAPADG